MISDDERREVAERMRVYSHDFDFGDSNPFWYVAKASFGDVDMHTYYSVFARLADLIELPTCTMEKTDSYKTDGGETVNVWECSRCGETCEEVNGSYEFCPHCGAMVVEEGGFDVRKL